MFGMPLSLSLGLAVGWILLASVAEGAEQYPLGPDSQSQAVPHGTVTHHTWTSKIFPGTTRDYWVYVPAQYTADKPACVMIFQDGGGYVNEQGRMRVPVVFDNLINKGDMPVTIGIFLNPGGLPPVVPGQSGRPNRSFEYDAVSDRYARFLLEEILPEVGKQYHLSTDPNDRALCGTSSGGICSFTAAWFRPDAFRRVLSIVGSYSDLRGGDIYPSLIRKTETKPLRVFLQSGKHDMNTYAGSWYVQNQAMAAAFEYMGYDYQVVLGEEGHNDLQGSSLFPDALRWLWRDYPKPITAPVPPSNRQWATDIVVPGKGWEPVAEGYDQAGALTADHVGDVFFIDREGQLVMKISADGHISPFLHHGCVIPNGLCIGPDKRIYVSDLVGKVVAYGADGKETVLATDGSPTDLVVDKHGGVYYTDMKFGCVWYVNAPHGHQSRHYLLRSGAPGGSMASGLRLSPDGSFLAVADMLGRWVQSFQVQADGSVGQEEAFYRLETTDESSMTGASGLAWDSDGYLYVATDPGIQVCDQEGRVAFIMASPPNGPASCLAFGGSDFHTLYAIAGGKIYRRPVTRKGVPGW